MVTRAKQSDIICSTQVQFFLFDVGLLSQQKHVEKLWLARFISKYNQPLEIAAKAMLYSAPLSYVEVIYIKYACAVTAVAEVAAAAAAAVCQILLPPSLHMWGSLTFLALSLQG